MVNRSLKNRRFYASLFAAGLICLGSPSAQADTFYVTDSQSGTVLVYSQTGAPLPSLSTPGGSGFNSTFSPKGIAMDGTGNIYVANDYYNNYQIVKFSSAGAYLGVFSTNGLNLPIGLAIDSAGDVYVANFTTGILKFSPDGSSSTNWNGGGFALAFDSSGNLFIDGPYKYSPSLQPLSWGPASGPGSLSQPEGLAFDSAGNLYVSDYFNATVLKYSADGTQRSIFATNSLDGPQGLAFDSAGNLYVVNNGRYNIPGPHPLGGTVQKFGPDGTYLGQFVNTMGAAHYILIVRSAPVTGPAIPVPSVISSGSSGPATLTLSFDSSATGFTLQSSGDLSVGGNGWSSFAAINGATNVSISASNSARFFRLKK